MVHQNGFLGVRGFRRWLEKLRNTWQLLQKATIAVQIPSWANRLEEKTLLVSLSARLGCHLNRYLLCPSPVPGTGCERLRLRTEEEVIVTWVTIARSESCM